jgi:serine/threonine protein kinase
MNCDRWSWSLFQAQTLTKIHHKNLVSMIGYCKDGDYMALVYEYMSEGSLQEHISGMLTCLAFMDFISLHGTLHYSTSKFKLPNC